MLRFPPRKPRPSEVAALERWPSSSAVPIRRICRRFNGSAERLGKQGRLDSGLGRRSGRRFSRRLGRRFGRRLGRRLGRRFGRRFGRRLGRQLGK